MRDSGAAARMVLVRPAQQYLPGYVEALRRDWSPDNLRPAAAREQLELIALDPAGFLARQEDRAAKGPPVQLPDGRTAPRLPGYHRWLWDGEFCGVIGFRWQPGTTELPPHCLGHIGYAVVPWKRGRGYATRALALMLPEVEREGLEFVDITTEATNTASQHVVEANGGVLIERWPEPLHGGAETLRYRIFFHRGPT